MSQQIRLAISTCPNDTFAFHALMNRQVDWRGLQFETELLDIQQLNNLVFKGDFDFAKASFHAACHLIDETVVLPSGSAMGFGVGPLLLSATSGSVPHRETQLTLCPGEFTTANLLFQMFYPATTRIEQTLFSEIMPRLERAEADFGVCIHEGRFTWQDRRLGLVQDLGARWETETSCPLPLGGILASRKLPEKTIRLVQNVIRDSIESALKDPEQALPTMRKYAQEFSDDVLMQHVKLYVNDWTVELGQAGAAALAELSGRCSLASGTIEIFSCQ